MLARFNPFSSGSGVPPRWSRLALAISLLGALSGCRLPDPSVLKNHWPAVHYRGKGKPAEITLQKTPPAGWTPYLAVSKVAVGAIVVSEDWAFYQHKGIDTNQIKEAIEQDIEERRFARGASTITQQVAKNVFLDSDKNLLRKVKEVILAMQMEKSLKKNRILEIYLNIAEWGEGIFGIRAAAKHYFDKSPADLTAREGAFLAMLLPSPKRYSQSFRAKKLTGYAARRIDSILEKMVQAKYLTEEELLVERDRPLPFEQPEPTETPSAPPL